MGFLLGLLTVVLAINCIFLILLILIQLPKKEAGLGTAFGGAATDALFGAGTGNALTKLTRYSATSFFILALFLSVVNAKRHGYRQSLLKDELRKQVGTPAALVTPPPASSVTLTGLPAATPTNLLTLPTATSAVERMVAPATNTAPSTAPSTPAPAPAPAAVAPTTPATTNAPK